jgi:hypothetical protein
MKHNVLSCELKRAIQNIDNNNDREISQTMFILISALQVGPNVDRLANHTACPREVVERIVLRMHEANLWHNDLIDDREWWDDAGELNGVGLFSHALVALGKAEREATPNGAKYIDTETGEVMGLWPHPHSS